MKRRHSESDKEKILSEAKNLGNISTHSLLDKLSSEIATEFQGEQNAGIYNDSVKKMLSLKEKINQKTADFSELQKELQNLSAHLSEEKKKEFYNAIEGAREVLKNSQDLIASIKDEINIFTPTDGDFTTKIFGQKNIARGKNPQNITDNIIGGGIGLFNSSEAIARITVSLLIGVGKSIPDTYKILTGKAETDAFKNV